MPFFGFHRTGTKFNSGLLVCVWLSLAAPDVVLLLCLPDTRRKPGLSSLPVIAVSLLLVFLPFFLLCCGRQLSASPRVSAALTSSGGLGERHDLTAWRASFRGEEGETCQEGRVVTDGESGRERLKTQRGEDEVIIRFVEQKCTFSKNFKQSQQ